MEGAIGIPAAILEGMTSTTIKVSRELRDRLAEIARDEGTTLAGAIEQALDSQADATFWSEIARTMGTAVASPGAMVDAALADGLDPAEDWSDVW